MVSMVRMVMQDHLALKVSKDRLARLVRKVNPVHLVRPVHLVALSMWVIHLQHNEDGYRVESQFNITEATCHIDLIHLRITLMK
jgi:hypothetical protein